MAESTYERMQRGVAEYNANPDNQGKPGGSAGAPQPSTYACPSCDKAGQESRLMSFPSKSGLGCPNGHVFNDLNELVALEPRKLGAPAPRLQPPPQGAVEMRVMVPGETKAKLEERFKNKLNASITAVLGVMADPRAFIIGGVDCGRLEEALKEPIKDAQKLLGKIFEMTGTSDTLAKENEIMRAKATGGAKVSYVANPEAGDMIINFGDPLTQAIMEKAKGYGITPEKLVSDTIKNASDQGWL